MAINNVVIVGRLTKDPVVKMTSNQKSVVAFTIAVQRDKTKADFIPCRAYSGTADLLVRYCKKGSQIGLTGSINTYTTERDGKTEYHVEILVNSLAFLDSKPKEETSVEEEPSVYVDPNADLPF